MFNTIKKEKVMSNNKVWLVIEKNVFGDSQSFSVAKFADTIEGAVKFKVHLEALNDRKNQTYFLASDSDTVMDKVVSAHNKSVSNGTYYEKHPEVKKPSEEEMPF
jgi:hypothetical protein